MDTLRTPSRSKPSDPNGRVGTLFITCGLPGSGKTTMARRLETAAGALRLTGDDWLRLLFPSLSTAQAEYGPERRRVERVQWDIAERALQLGASVVVDWGVWTRAERDVLRDAARALGARVVLCDLHAPLQNLWARVERRNHDRSVTAFAMTRADLERWSELFEPPGEEEKGTYDAWPSSLGRCLD